MGPGRLERPEGDEEPSVLPPRSRSDQVVQLWNRRCTREHHGKKWDFFVAESDEELESTSVFFQMNQFTFFSLRQLAHSGTRAPMKKITLMHRQSGFQTRPSASSEIRCRISSV